MISDKKLCDAPLRQVVLLGLLVRARQHGAWCCSSAQYLSECNKAANPRGPKYMINNHVQ